MTITTQYGTEKQFAYHDYGYVKLAPNDGINFSGILSHTSGSTAATIYLDAPEDLTGSYLYVNGSWKKVNSM